MAQPDRRRGRSTCSAGCAAGLDEPRRAELLERFELDPTKKGRAYSKGNRQKVALVAAFAADVELLVLDEPTSGLDPLMESVFQDVRRRVRDGGRTVLLSSHILAEVERLVRPGDDHPGRPRRRDRHAGRPAAPDPHVRRRPSSARRPPASTGSTGVHDLVVEGNRVASRSTRPRSTLRSRRWSRPGSAP